MIGPPHSHSVKSNNKNGRQTKPHPQLTQVSEDSLRPVESNADLQFLVNNFYEEKLTLARDGVRANKKV